MSHFSFSFWVKNVMQAKGNLVLLVPSIVIAVLVGIGMFYRFLNQNPGADDLETERT